MNITIQKLTPSRTQATIVLDDARVRSLEEEAVKELGKNIEMKGFRPGEAPKDMLRARIPQDRIHEYVVQHEMPAIMQEVVEKHDLKPIIRPRVELKEIKPMTLAIVLVEKPEVKVATRKIKLPKEKAAPKNAEE